MPKKRVLITGAGTGIGKDTAKHLVGRGHSVIAAVHHADQVAPLQTDLGPSAKVIKLDITIPEDRLQIAELGVDVLINNAAQSESGSLAEIKIDRVRRLFEVNVFSALELSQIAIRSMIERGGGTVIFISSITGRIPEPFLMPYSMSKFAISAAAAGLREEMKTLDKGIHVSVVEPGPYSTGFNQRLSNSRFEWMEKEGSLFSPKQIAAMKSDTDRKLSWLEVGTTDTIVKKITAAAEASKPRLRYVAPWTFALLVRVLRILGV
ncbi:short-subunit dehydrogenase [Roseibium hamelinense]|uniref:Short-subunit dehydrogenase n=1 Tax=Roseibium hamelinense TaxID=150831 RepID=A0A562SBF6_9HYPH|nr:SDR family NAD(P)-dependent oxidoreductase [Roseibium hamelinense]MTI42089.1 SDR family NAD(P)-dependent oxidoreductase [Roseibium hamelinense]TWI78695.1 short-subunit dehydrogenase [Roseibium hamelinense]